MEKQKITNDQKRKIIIVICSVVLMLLALFILFAIIHGNKKSNTTTTDEGKKLKGLYIGNTIVEADHYELTANQEFSRCLDSPNICLDKLEVIKYNEHGLILYQLSNHSGSWLSGNIRITLKAAREGEADQTLTFIVPYRNLGSSALTFYYGFDGWNDFPVSSISDYEFEPGLYTDSEALYENLNETEISQITVD